MNLNRITRNRTFPGVSPPAGIRWQNVAAFACCLWLMSCSSPKPGFKPVSQVPGGGAVVYLYRGGSAVGGCKILHDGKPLTSLKPNTYFAHHPAPGRVSYTVAKPFDLGQGLTGGMVKDAPPAVTTVPVEAGKIYYLRAQGWGSISLIRVDEMTGNNEIMACRLAAAAK